MSDKSCRENQNTHFMFSNSFENRAVYEIMWENIVEAGKTQMFNRSHSVVLYQYSTLIIRQ